ncbi:MAG: SUMF1/EgtB/PvdO family nonheme iron enzyme [Beijerinckiaceae bacterium]|nr:SUMF1/EgtB/PvdO family nonheme iron enzyme [Beijerinckiaceae bacterium]MCZ8299251.1 SUMF1/EgtB/PvdO family nonheme iron enzyme [Beijerinckiaceae bacterium]
MIRSAAVLALLLLGNLPSMADMPARIRIDAFEIDRTEVTVGAFRAYLARRGGQSAAEREGGGFEYAGGWVRRPGWIWSHPQGQPATDAEPVTHVSWDEARAFCADRGGRLPTLAEWRRAAFTETRDAPTDGFETGRTYRYAVGDSPEGMNNNRRHHVPVGTTKRGVNGLHDMGANVWEWLADRRGDEALTAGGSWWYGPEQSRAEGTQWKAASFTVLYIGFRCAYGG